MRPSPVLRSLAVCLVLGLAGCTGPADEPAVEGPRLPSGFVDEIVVRGLSGPTQVTLGPDGRLWVAQLDGGEEDGTGQVLAIDLDDEGGAGTPQVVVEDLQKPTGLAFAGDALWVQTERSLLRAPLDEEGEPGPLEPVLEGLPYNGRSEGTLTVTPDDDVLFETSGRREGDRGQAGSGTLQVQVGDAPESPPTLVAGGLKNAYAHVFDADGRLWTTDIGEPLARGADSPPEELNLVREGADYGWPLCEGDRQPAAALDVPDGACDGTLGPVATFPPTSTPTGLVASPFDDDVLLVALWVTGDVVAVDITDPEAGPVEPEPFASGYENPQHLLDASDGTLLLTEFTTGTVHRISRTGEDAG